jgi:N-acetylmuramoyl-L-alanine amidase
VQTHQIIEKYQQKKSTAGILEPNSWDGIGYHAVIRRSGLVEMGRPEYWSGAHVKGHNHESLGVCLIGRDQYTNNQLESLRQLLRDWKSKYPSAEILGHRDLDSGKTCPNFDVSTGLKLVRLNDIHASSKQSKTNLVRSKEAIQ